MKMRFEGFVRCPNCENSDQLLITMTWDSDDFLEDSIFVPRGSPVRLNCLPCGFKWTPKETLWIMPEKELEA